MSYRRQRRSVVPVTSVSKHTSFKKKESFLIYVLLRGMFLADPDTLILSLHIFIGWFIKSMLTTLFLFLLVWQPPALWIEVSERRARIRNKLGDMEDAVCHDIFGSSKSWSIMNEMTSCWAGVELSCSRSNRTVVGVHELALGSLTTYLLSVRPISNISNLGLKLMTTPWKLCSLLSVTVLCGFLQKVFDVEWCTTNYSYFFALKLSNTVQTASRSDICWCSFSRHRADT